MALNHDLVHAAFSSRNSTHMLVLADHVDEQGHPELADAFRNEEKSVRPNPWYDDDWGAYRGDYDFPPARYTHSNGHGVEYEERPEPPSEHIRRIQKKGLQLAPGIFALAGVDGFGPPSGYGPAKWNQGFHVYDLRGLEHEHEPDEDGLAHYDHSKAVPPDESFDSVMDYNAALEEYLGGRGAPRFFKYKGAHNVKLARASVITDQLSLQQRIRRALAVKIAREARLRLTNLADARSNNVAGVLQTYGHENDPRGVEYAAAWYGLLTKSPNVTTFHVHAGGPDTLHTWTTMMKPDNVLRVAGNLPAVVTNDGRVSIFDPGNKLANQIAKFKETSFAQNPQAEPGTAVVMPGRDAFRDKIREYQSS